MATFIAEDGALLDLNGSELQDLVSIEDLILILKDFDGVDGLVVHVVADLSFEVHGQNADKLLHVELLELVDDQVARLEEVYYFLLLGLAHVGLLEEICDF